MRSEDFFHIGRFRGKLLAAFLLTLATSLFFYYYQHVPLDLGSTTVLFAIIYGLIALLRRFWERANGRTDDDEVP
jgi:hypothetical protein